MTRPGRSGGRRRLLSLRGAAPLIVAGCLALAAAAYGYVPGVTELRAPATRSAAPAPTWKPRVIRTKTISRPPAPTPTPAAADSSSSVAPEPAGPRASGGAPDAPPAPSPARPRPEDLPPAARFLVRVAAAQDAFAAGTFVDEDHDRRGEYGGLAELTGAESGRMPSRLRTPALEADDARVDAAGVLARDGYLFRVYLPGRTGDGVSEQDRGFGAGVCDPDRAERAWACYAWPLRHGDTGSESFYLDQDGTLLVTDDPAYSGLGAAPAPDAARDAGSWRPIR